MDNTRRIDSFLDKKHRERVGQLGVPRSALTSRMRTNTNHTLEI